MEERKNGGKEERKTEDGKRKGKEAGVKRQTMEGGGPLSRVSLRNPKSETRYPPSHIRYSESEIPNPKAL